MHALQRQGISDVQTNIDAAFKILDLDQSGRISYEEFSQSVLRKANEKAIRSETNSLFPIIEEIRAKLKQSKMQLHEVFGGAIDKTRFAQT